MEESISAETILEWFKQAVKSKNQLDPSLWINAASKLAVLLGDEHDALFELQQKCAIKKIELYEGMAKPSSAGAEMFLEATDEYKEFKKQEARVKQVEEFIRISKLRAKISLGGY